MMGIRSKDKSVKKGLLPSLSSKLFAVSAINISWSPAKWMYNACNRHEEKLLKFSRHCIVIREDFKWLSDIEFWSVAHGD